MHISKTKTGPISDSILDLDINDSNNKTWSKKLNELYTSEWNDFHNYFSVSVKLISKYRVGSQINKKYDDPKTPVQRLLESEHISKQTKLFLSQI